MGSTTKKYIVQTLTGPYSAPQIGYMCHNNISYAYSAGVLEFNSEDEAKEAAGIRKVKIHKIIQVSKT